MDIDVVFTKKENISRAVIFLKDQNNQYIDGQIAVAFIKNDTEKIFIPAKDDLHFDPVYPSNAEDYVYRIEKGIYHASGEFKKGITKILVWAKAKDKTISKEITIEPDNL
ncbi:MAG: hypothetical protein V1718_00645 [archaeon]